MRAIEKRLRIRLSEKDNKITSLKDEIQKIRDDREKYRTYFKIKLQWFLKMHGENTTPNMAWLIEDCAKFMNSVERFWW